MAGKGSKPGERRGGRKKGTPNKATTAASIRAEIAASGELPLDYMLRVMRDETAEPHRRDAMAKAAAPYLHAQLSAIAHRHASADGSPVEPTIKNVFMVLPKTIEHQPAKTIEHQSVVPLIEDKTDEIVH